MEIVVVVRWARPGVYKDNRHEDSFTYSIFYHESLAGTTPKVRIARAKHLRRSLVHARIICLHVSSILQQRPAQALIAWWPPAQHRMSCKEHVYLGRFVRRSSQECDGGFRCQSPGADHCSHPQGRDVVNAGKHPGLESKRLLRDMNHRGSARYLTTASEQGLRL